MNTAKPNDDSVLENQLPLTLEEPDDLAPVNTDKPKESEQTPAEDKPNEH